jgi:hypothetical protein
MVRRRPDRPASWKGVVDGGPSFFELGHDAGHFAGLAVTRGNGQLVAPDLLDAGLNDGVW